MSSQPAGSFLTIFMFGVLVLSCGSILMSCCPVFVSVCTGTLAIPTSSFLPMTSVLLLAFFLGMQIDFSFPASPQPRFPSFSTFDPGTRTVPLFLLNEVYRL